MQRHRSCLAPLAFRTSVIVTLSVASALLSCGSSDDDDDEHGTTTPANGGTRAEECYSCGVEACPNEATACDDSPGCVTWRDCTLGCAATDASCQNECTTDASSDANAIVLGGTFVACATVNCPAECVGSPSSGPSSGPSSSPGPGGTPTPGAAGLCEELNDWAVGCNLDVTSQIPDCSLWTAEQECMANCITDASCADYEAASAGSQNTLTSCLTDCISAATPGTPTPVGPSTPTPSQPPTTGFFVAEGGFVTSGTWQGFAWTGTDSTSASTIQPADFSGSLGGGSLCASGTVVGTTDYSAVAMVGINLNQPSGDPAPAPAAWTPPPGSLGIGYDIFNIAGSPLRIQIQAPGGDTNANLRFCVEAHDLGTYAWSSFNTACWDDSGSSYDGTTPLESIMVLVPGAQTDTFFDFCVQSLSPQ